MMSKQKSLLIIIALVVCIINVFVFLTMSKYVEEHNTAMNMIMYYLTFIITLMTLPISYLGYRNFKSDSKILIITINILF